jgi:hypothetical protein
VARASKSVYDIASTFNSKGYAPIQSVLDADLSRFLYDHLSSLTRGEMRCDRQVPDTPAGYADPLFELLLDELRPAIERWSGSSVFPTYSYFRVYKHGDVLRPHKDRPACEISLSVCVGYVSPQPWPLFVEGRDGIFKAVMEPGDGLLYRGIECPHWREPFPGTVAAQVFFHYVAKDGLYSEWRYDRRQGFPNS